MIDNFGLFIENEQKGKYRYYIMNEEDISKNGLRSWLYNTFCVSNALANSQSIKDRIHGLHTTDETFELPKDWKAEDYFENCFGIIADQRIEPQDVKLKVSAGQANYIRDLEIHESQEEIEQNEEYSIFKCHLRPSFDFIQEIQWNGEDMEVLEPLSLRKEIAGIIGRMNKKYQED